MRVISGVDELSRLVGENLGSSEWFDISQETIDEFADVTGDNQWIHTDPVRAAAESPYGGTVAHGFLTLSLIPAVVAQVYRVDGTRLMVNYGVNKVRFPAPLRSGTRVRGEVELVSVTPIKERFEIITRVTFHAEGGVRPVCVAESVRLLVPEDGGSGGA